MLEKGGDPGRRPWRRRRRRWEFERDFAASRLRVIPLISHEGPRRREEAMIADLRHYPAMKKELPFTLCVLCELCDLCG